MPRRWPGGVPLGDLSKPVISRAYWKMAEAIAWSRFPIVAGQWCVELGAAPGGACQYLLERGLHVIAVDPADLDDRLKSEPNLIHMRCRSREVRRARLKHARWLFADLNVAPTYTLDTVGDLVSSSKIGIHGMLLTLKLMSLDLVQNIPEFIARVAGWGFSGIHVRQLAFNRREVCLMAVMEKSEHQHVQASATLGPIRFCKPGLGLVLLVGRDFDAQYCQANIEQQREAHDMSNEVWYYSEGERQKGPVSADDLKELVEKGHIKPTDLVWQPGMGDWVAANTIRGLRPDDLHEIPLENLGKATINTGIDGGVPRLRRRHRRSGFQWNSESLDQCGERYGKLILLAGLLLAFLLLARSAWQNTSNASKSCRGRSKS